LRFSHVFFLSHRGLVACGDKTKRKGKTYEHVIRGSNWDLDDVQKKEPEPRRRQVSKKKTEQEALRTPRPMPAGLRPYQQ
jgi:hypothetical protein